MYEKGLFAMGKNFDHDGYYDEIGGYHEGGTGTAPNEEECGECSRRTCRGCAARDELSPTEAGR